MLLHSSICIVFLTLGSVYSLKRELYSRWRGRSGSGTTHRCSASAKDEVLNTFAPKSSDSNSIFVCPETLNKVTKEGRLYGFSKEEYFKEKEFGSKYNVENGYYDFTIKKEIEKPLWELSGSERIGQTFFQNPIISRVYERGYRQQFQTAGFPGIDKEFEEIEQFFVAAKAETVLDISCGSGFMTRKLLQSGNFSRVICGDLSKTMLAETIRNIKAEGLQVPEAVRCDSARLPFETGSLDAVHAGAAMHCWPRLAMAIQEIHRVLRPGGVFYASTFFTSAYNMPERMPRAPAGTGFFFFMDEAEILKFVEDNGFSVEVVAADDSNSNSDNDKDKDSNSNKDKDKEGTLTGGMTRIRREGRSCAIVKCIKLPNLSDVIPGQMTPGVLTKKEAEMILDAGLPA